MFPSKQHFIFIDKGCTTVLNDKRIIVMMVDSHQIKDGNNEWLLLASGLFIFSSVSNLIILVNKQIPIYQLPASKAYCNTHWIGYLLLVIFIPFHNSHN